MMSSGIMVTSYKIMKLLHTVKKNTSHTLKLFRKKTGLIISILFLPLIALGGFFITRGATPHTSELSYIESSRLGKEAGSVIPASCDSWAPFTSPTSQGGTAGSHFASDCSTTCPGGNGTYDPYYDPSATGCPAPTSVSFPADVVINYGGYTPLWYSSTGASACQFYATNDFVTWGSWIGAPLAYDWGTYGPFYAMYTYYVTYCQNGGSGSTGGDTMIYVKPSVPTSPIATCNTADGTSATISWGASANANLGYYLRMTAPAGYATPAGWTNYSGTSYYPPGDTYTSTSYSFTTSPDQPYSWWVHGRNSYVYSDPVGTTFTCHKPSGSVTFSASSCAIATGASSCTVNASWNVSYPFGGNISTLVRDNPSRTDYTQDVAAAPGVPVTVYGPPASSLTTITLKNSGLTLDTKTVTASCGAGGWDTVSGTCQDPQVVSAGFVGQYYPLGTLSLTCSGSDSYSVELGGVPIIPVTAYSGPVTFNNINVDGNYTIQCRYGSLSSQVARRYNATPPPAVVGLTISPTTLTKDDDVIVKWDTTFPTNACTLTARVVCANNSCTIAQTAAQTALNAILAATTTDPDDKHGSRSLQTAIKTVAPGHKDNDSPIITTDWKALGKKTLRILYTTDLTYECSPTSKETKRIQVTKSSDQ